MTVSTAPVTHEQNEPKLMGHLGQVHPMMAEKGLSHALSALIELRASQINQCAYCVNMHIEQARNSGVTQEQLDKLVVWQHTDVFSAAERAVLAWVEALTILKQDTDFAALRAQLRAHFTDNEITVITADVGMINLWNRVQMSKY
ncbi:carboxymuconolactone decarboxylase family protein [Ruegeria sp. EL01]|jgi:AhpD family alkylhydroperoxidase|uniref:carboxymuconolactone decarboxylase family protein n=1 Tax=Ruegeria sp. EL01 TaxID=2107578 RepID=UPI000EA80EFE|nr:carboxymuconolactone decarboxylase family protein [Ruegeria sp. EL01]